MLFINRFVTHCCCFIPLRLACVLIFIVEIFFTFLGMCLGQASSTNWCWLLLRLGFMLHLIGSVMLLVGNIFKITNLLLFYLITNLLHIIFAAIYIIVWIIRCDYCFYQLCVSSIGLVLIFGLLSICIAGNVFGKSHLIMSNSKSRYLNTFKCNLKSLFRASLLSYYFLAAFISSKIKASNSLNQIKCKAELKIMPNELQKNKNKSSCCCCDVLSIGLLLLQLQITSFRCNFQSRAKCWQTDRQKIETICLPTLACNMKGQQHNSTKTSNGNCCSIISVCTNKATTTMKRKWNSTPRR